MNTSGSGKTRLLLEGLCSHWGFYFTCSNSGTNAIGSIDLPNLISSMDTKTGFRKMLDLLPLTTKSKCQLENNIAISHRYFCYMLLGCLSLFKLFLELFKCSWPHALPNKL
jgi:hypothetical protein